MSKLTYKEALGLNLITGKLKLASQPHLIIKFIDVKSALSEVEAKHQKLILELVEQFESVKMLNGNVQVDFGNPESEKFIQLVDALLEKKVELPDLKILKQEDLAKLNESNPDLTINDLSTIKKYMAWK